MRGRGDTGALTSAELRTDWSFNMSPTTQPVRNIKVKVPRHNSQRIGPAVTAQVETLAREAKVRVDVRQTAYESSSALAQAIVIIILGNMARYERSCVSHRKAHPSGTRFS